MVNGEHLLKLKTLLEKKIEAVSKQIGPPGKDGKDAVAKDGKDGKAGKQGLRGLPGKDGTDGSEGVDGISVEDARIDFDHHLVLILSDGTELDAGELPTSKGEGDRYYSISGGGGGGDLDVASNAITATFVAAEALAEGEICHLDSSGQMELASAVSEPTAKSLLAVATSARTTGQSGTFILSGNVALSGYTTGAPLFLSNAAGLATVNAPTSGGNIQRVIGYSLSATVINFNPDKTWIEVN